MLQAQRQNALRFRANARRQLLPHRDGQPGGFALDDLVEPALRSARPEILRHDGQSRLGRRGQSRSEILYSQQSPSWCLPAPYYTYTCGPVQFFAFDTNDVSEPQLGWLTRSAGQQPRALASGVWPSSDLFGGTTRRQRNADRSDFARVERPSGRLLRRPRTRFATPQTRRRRALLYQRRRRCGDT